MKKWLLVAGVLAVVVLGVVVFALPALGQAPTNPPAQNQPYGNGCLGNGSALGSYGMMGGGYMGLGNQVTLKRVADTLGLTSDQLTARLQQGETLAQIAQAQNVSTDAVVTAILAPQSEMMQVAVKYGYMTQAQAQTMLDQMTQQAGQMMTSQAYGRQPVPANPNTGTLPGTSYGRGGMMGGGFGGGIMGGWTPSSPNSGSSGYGFGGRMMGW